MKTVGSRGDAETRGDVLLGYVFRVSGLVAIGQTGKSTVPLTRDDRQKRTTSAPPRLRANQPSFFS